MPRINPGNVIAGAVLGQTLQNRTDGDPIIYSQDIQGGLTNVDNEAGRLSLSPRLIQPGMIVHQEDTGDYWRFLGTDGTNPITLQTDGTFNYASPPTSPATTIAASWGLIAFNAAEPAILDSNGVPSLAPGIMASEIRNLIGEGEEGFLINFRLIRAADTFNGGSWGGVMGTTAGQLTHTGIGANPRVYLNGVLLQPDTDYTVDDAMNMIQLMPNIYTAIVDDNRWCISVVDTVDSSTAGSLPSLAGSLEYVGPNFVSHTVTTQEYTNAVDDTVDMTVSGTVSTSATPPVQVATYDVVYIPGRGAGEIEIRVTPIEGWTVESTATQNFDRNPDNSYRHRFSLPAAATTFRVVELIDTGLFFDAPNNYGRTKLSNDPITNTTIDALGYTTTDGLDSRYQAIETTGNAYITQTALTTALAPYELTSAVDTKVPVTITRDDTFPDNPIDGDQHFLTTNIYASTLPTSPVTLSGVDSGSTIQEQEQVFATINDPITDERVVCGLVSVDQERDPVPNSIVTQAVSGATTYGLSNRDHTFRGFHLSRLVNAGGGTTNAIYVTETMGNTVTHNGEVVQNAIWYNVHIRVQTSNAIGLAGHVINDASYVFIQFTNDAALNVNTRLTADTAIDTMLGYLSNDSALIAGLVHNTNVASSVTTRATYTGGNIMVSRAQPDQLTSVYSFIPQNGFTIDTTNTFVTGTPLTVLPNNRILARVAGGVVSWQATFQRTYQVPTGDPTPEAPEGQYVYDNGWRQVTLGSAVTLT